MIRGIITFCEQEHRGNNVLMFLYTAHALTGALAESPEGELAWVETTRLHELPMYEGDALFLRWMREDGKFSAKFCYGAQGRLVSHTCTVYSGEKG